MKRLLRKCSNNMIMYIATNNSFNDSSQMILDELLTLKEYMSAVFHHVGGSLSSSLIQMDALTTEKHH